MWQTTPLYEHEIHVHPLNDVREHILSRECWCGPAYEHHSGSVIWVHNPMDGRRHAS